MKKRIVYINLGNYGSTGKIVDGLIAAAEANGDIVLRCYPASSMSINKKENDYVICSYTVRRINHRLSIHTGLLGCFALLSTLRMIKVIKQFNADIVHLHNLHGDYINLPILFQYLKKSDVKIVWTLHDCWAFTGRCPYFEITACDKWEIGCGRCKYPKDRYPESFIDLSKQMWRKKKKLFTGITDMVLVTPSKWLAGLVKQSYMKEYPVQVIYNGIDLQTFQPTPSSFRARFHCEEKFLLLGVAFGWGERKGLDVFLELSRRLDSRFQIILVGTNDNVDRLLPENVISIHRTESQTKLAEIYTAADLFLNPTREDNFPTVNLEALACGTPILAFRTGGSPECVDKTCGSVVDCNDVDELEREIKRICEDAPYSEEDCIKRARLFDGRARFLEYVRLYERECV